MSAPCTPRDWIEHLVTNAFAATRTPRSEEYKAGLRTLLAQRFTSRPMTCPHKPGTASYDAFFAGVHEGCSIWADYVAEHRSAA